VTDTAPALVNGILKLGGSKIETPIGSLRSGRGTLAPLLNEGHSIATGGPTEAESMVAPLVVHLSPPPLPRIPELKSDWHVAQVWANCLGLFSLSCDALLEFGTRPEQRGNELEIFLSTLAKNRTSDRVEQIDPPASRKVRMNYVELV
jgi:hypothetical protein